MTGKETVLDALAQPQLGGVTLFRPDALAGTSGAVRDRADLANRLERDRPRRRDGYQLPDPARRSSLHRQ